MQVSDRLSVDETLHRFVEAELLARRRRLRCAFWQAMEDILADFTPLNRDLLERRDALQSQIDGWWREHRRRTPDVAEQTRFLSEIGYLLPEPPAFRIETANVDPEIAQLAGPQLVVPVSNARYALNAANARGAASTTRFMAPMPSRRRARWRATTRNAAPRSSPMPAPCSTRSRRWWPARTPTRSPIAWWTAPWSWASRMVNRPALESPDQFVGWRGPALTPQGILLRHHGLHLEILIHPLHPVGKDDPAHVADVLVEAALTVIQDCEDFVAAVDAEDKTEVYRNWLGLMRGDLSVSFGKGGRTSTRRLEEDRHYTRRGGALTLRGRSLMLVRNVGHHMTSDAVLFDGAPAFETVLDALITVTAALHDLSGARRNSATGSVYVVKPKMHGPDEVALAVRLFDQVEDALGLPRDTVKIGIMDEERRTSANLRASIHAARRRVFFINTGFLDRTGDEIHTAMEAGPVVRKEDMKSEPWLAAYEKRNVEIGLAAGFPGHAQIGKGMWAAPDQMKAMLAAKVGHLRAGASTAWVRRPPPRCCTPCIIMRSTWPLCKTPWARPERREPRTCSSRLSPVPTGTPRISSRNSTTTPRASSAMWCAGSTRGSVVPRCPISTTSV